MTSTVRTVEGASGLRIELLAATDGVVDSDVDFELGRPVWVDDSDPRGAAAFAFYAAPSRLAPCVCPSGIQCVERLSKLKRRKRAAWGALRNIEGVVKKAKNMRLDAHLFDTAVLTVPIHASTEGNPEFRAPSSNEDQQCRNYAKESKIRWTGHFMRYSDDCWTRALTEWISRNVKRTLRRP
nr:unnamed protein product [Haemonchus contortus]